MVDTAKTPGLVQPQFTLSQLHSVTIIPGLECHQIGFLESSLRSFLV